MKKTGIGFVGVGNISGIYLKNLTSLFREVEIVGVCDLIPEKAQKAHDEYGVHVYKDMYELFDDPKVDIVLNITEPNNHYKVSREALLHGKHVYSEKPLATKLEDGRELVKLSLEKKLYVGGAPDTFMGAGIQTCRRLIDDGYIGKPFGGTARLLGRGPESWHPNPGFFYEFGAGPLFDMGPYYITALVNLLGRVNGVSAVSTKAYDERIATCKEQFGKVLPVEVPTYNNAIFRFDSGAQVAMTISFDTFGYGVNPIEIYGTEGTLYVPDPNTFGGPVKLQRPGQAPMEIPLMYGYSDNSRGLGLCDMAKAIAAGRDYYRACSMQQLHVLEIMCSFYTSSDAHAETKIESEFERKSPMEYTTVLGVL